MVKGVARPRQIGSERLIMPDTCLGQPAPCRILTSARAAVRTGAGPVLQSRRTPAIPLAQVSAVHELPGPVERILQDLGVTSTDVLHHTAVIDQAGELLIIDATRAMDPRRSAFNATLPSRSAGTAEIINHLLATGNPSAATILRPPPPPARHDPDQHPLDQRRQPDHPVARQTPEPEAEP